MKFCSLVLELHLPQNFCHIHTDIFQKQSNRVHDIPKRVNPSKTGNRKFARNQYFLLFTYKKVKNEEKYFPATIILKFPENVYYCFHFSSFSCILHEKYFFDTQYMKIFRKSNDQPKLSFILRPQKWQLSAPAKVKRLKYDVKND